MESGDEVVEVDRLERSLLADTLPGAEDDSILYSASFEEMEENFVKYQTARWVLYSLLLLLAWGIGLFMLLYLPVRRYVARKDICSRKLYVTPDAIAYEVKRPVPFPCFGFLKREKHVLLPSVADVVIEQGYLQSLFGVYSVRIENVGVRRPPNDDVQIVGVTNPNAFRKAVVTRLSNMKTEIFSRQLSLTEDIPSWRTGHPAAAWMSPSKTPRHEAFPHANELIILQKLEEVGSSV
ncbi:hypothetical protein RJ641_026621, partial [Dillenia turbinata]